jgi:hypothetical protein
MAFALERGAPKTVIGSVTKLTGEAGQAGQLILVREHKIAPEFPRSSDDLRLTREALDTLARAEQSLNVLSRSLTVLVREKILNNPTALRSFELMRNDFERLFAIVRVLKDLRGKR